MKNLLYALALVCSVSFANNNPENFANNDPKVGDVLKISTPKNLKFNHIDFPRLNEVVKRGGVSNYKSVYGELVIVKKIVNENGDIHVVLERKDGKKFFGFQKQVVADYHDSIESGEIIKIQS